MSNGDNLFGEATEKLRQAIKEGRTFDTAQVKVIGLNDIRQAAGAKWEQIRTRVHESSLNFLRSKLAEADLLIPCGNGFLVIYAIGENRDLEQSCRQLQEDLNLFYLGQEGMQKLRTEVAGRKLDATGMATIVATASADVDFAPDQVGETLFMPIWDVGHEMVTTYIVTPTLRDGDSIRAGYNMVYRMVGRHEQQLDFLDLDLDILERAIQAIMQRLEIGAPCLIGYSVHSTTLQRRSSRERYIKRLSQTPEPLRKYLTGRIMEIEPGTPAVTIADWVGHLQRFSPRINLDLHPQERSLHGLDATRAWSVGCYLPMYGPLNPTMRVQYRSLITRWRLAIQRQGLRVFFDNMLDPVLLSAACVEGVDYAASTRFWPFVSKPAGVVPSSRQMILGQSRQMGVG